jgi:glutathione synthase/RimK-type ligase-like ATP-grasp enzyme
MNKPIIAVYTTKATDLVEPQFNSPYFALAYADLFKFLIQKGAQPIVIYDAEKNYLGDSECSKYWRADLKNGKIVYEKVDQPVKIDVLYDKSRFPFSDLLKINPDELTVITNDKYRSYLFAPSFHAKSFLLRDQDDLRVFSLVYSAQKVALKELDSCGGERVFVGELADYDNRLNFPLLAQEFIDTSGGVKGLTNGLHDVRIGLFNGKLICGLLRIPKQNSLISNFCYGGTARVLKTSEVPSELIEKTVILDRRLGIDAPRFWCADWGFDKASGKWKIFELNASVGLHHESQTGPVANEFLELLADGLLESAQRK